MSGRSAYVRKKIGTEATKDGKKGSRSQPPPPGPGVGHFPRYGASGYGYGYNYNYEHDDGGMGDFAMPTGSAPVGTGVGTTNARFLKFSDPLPEPESPSGTYVGRRNHNLSSSMSISSGGSSGEGRRDMAFQSPTDEFDYDDAFGRGRKQTLKTEDVSGIERSGLRSMLDKKSDDVRKGIAKTFAFRKKDKDSRRDSLDNKGLDYRPPSVATVRPQPFPQDAVELENGPWGSVAAPVELESTIPRLMSPQGRRPTNQSLVSHLNTNIPSELDPWGEAAPPPPPPPTSKLPPLPAAAQPPPMKRWTGAGRPVQRWNKLRKDPELWDPNGDVLVFFGHRGQTPKPNPSFRLSSHIIESTESRPLITMLREGSVEEDLHVQMPPSPHGAPLMLRQERRRGTGSNLAVGPSGQPTPPVSEDNHFVDADGQISYEIYFPTPSGMSKVDQFRHHIATRNVFALFYHASLVGISLYQALSDLHSRLDAYLPADSDNVATLINYLMARELDDVRGDAETAVGLLAWSEGPEVRWEEGWRETFVHCAGMYNRLEQCTDFRSLAPVTRALLERASLETQLRIQGAEERLVELQCPEMWPTSGLLAHGQAKAAADRLQKFLLGHYSRAYGSWPPSRATDAENQGTGGAEDMWLTRTVAHALQNDFGALYDYLVDRDIVWDGSEARSGRKWMMVSKSGNRAFEADTMGLPLTDMLVEYDNKLRFPHIPHPYPLVPESIPPVVSPSGGKESSFMFKSSKKNTSAIGDGGSSGPRNAALDRRVQLAYTEATNIYALGSEFTHSDLIDAFVKFEKTDRVGEVDPAVARRGRWVLIYGLLQTLASVSVDSPGVRYRDDVPYHLSPRLRGTRIPPWKGHGVGTGTDRSSRAGPHKSACDEAAHELSHCWLVPQTWGRSDDEHGGGRYYSSYAS